MNENQWAVKNTNAFYLKTPKGIDFKRSEDGPEILEAFDLLDHEWIGITSFLSRLTHFLSNIIFLDGEEIVKRIVKSGLREYWYFRTRADKHFYPHERLKMFIEACASEAYQTCAFEIVDKSKNERWDITSKTDLAIWRFNREELQITPIKLEKKECIKIFYDKAVPENLKRVMRKFNHEQAILGGSLGICS